MLRTRFAIPVATLFAASLLTLACEPSGPSGSGATGRFKRHKETAMEYAFMIDLVDVTE